MENVAFSLKVCGCSWTYCLQWDWDVFIWRLCQRLESCKWQELSPCSPWFSIYQHKLITFSQCCHSYNLWFFIVTISFLHFWTGVVEVFTFCGVYESHIPVFHLTRSMYFNLSITVKLGIFWILTISLLT